PRICEIINVSKNRSAISEVKIPVFKWKMGSCRYCSKFERRTEVLLAPFDTTSVNVKAPNLTLRGHCVEPSDHAACAAAEIQDAIAFLECELRGIGYTYHFTDMLFA